MSFAGLHAEPSRLVRPPRVAGIAAALECKWLSTTQLETLEGTKMDQYLVLGQVVGVHIDKAFLKDGQFDMTLAHTIARCGYRGDYAEITRLFEMLRPT